MTRSEPHEVELATDEQTVGVAVHTTPNLLQGVAKATHQLLSLDNYSTAINQALETLGQATGVDRVYIFEVHPHLETGEPARSQRFEWARETVTAEINNPKWQNCSYTACGVMHWYETLQGGHSFSAFVPELSAVERQILEPAGVVSILIVPIPVNGKLWGFMGFDDCHTQRRWSEDETAVLMTMATTIGSKLAHHQTADALRQSQLRLERIAANVPGLIFQFLQRPDGSRFVLYASSGCRELYELEPEDIKANYQTLCDLIHPEDRTDYEQSVTDSAIKGEPWTWEGRIVTPSGKLKWVQGTSRLERHPNGDLLWDGVLVDITDRKQAEEGVRASEARLQSFFDATFEAVLIHAHGRILDINPAAEILFGYAKSELINRSVLDITAPCSRELVQRRAQFPSDQPLEAVGLKKDGTTFIGEVTGKSINYQGHPARVTGIRDITARKQAENILRQSEARNRALVNAIPDMILHLSSDGTFLDIKAENSQDLLAPINEMLGKTFYEILPSPLATLIQEQITQLLTTKMPQTVEYELPVRGESRYWEARLVMCGEDEVLVIVRNITERKCAEAERQLRYQRDRLLAQIALRIRQSLDLEQILQTTVAQVRQFLECDRVFFTNIDQQLQDKFTAESVDSNWGSVLGLLQNNPTYTQEIKTVFSSGKVQIINDTATADISPLRKQYFAQCQVKACLAVPIMVNDKLFGNLVAHQCDRTRQWQPFEVDLLRSLAIQVAIAIQQAQLYQQVQTLNTNLEHQVEERTQQLQQKYTELQELNQLKDVFLHAVSHDLRTPVLGWLMVLKNLLNTQKVGSFVPQTTENEQHTILVSARVLERMVQSCDRQLRLINSLLEVHTSEMVGIVLKREPLQLPEWVKLLVEDFEALAAKNQVTLINKVPKSLPAINVDPGQLRRVYENLLTNAFNHNPPGIKITLNAKVESQKIRCTVADNGVGISQDMCDRLFQLYFTGGNRQGLAQSNRPYTGLGLGLYLCRQIITAHGGEIGMNSRLGAGTTFWFTLPIHS